MIQEEVYLQDEKESFYIYRQTMKGRIQTGLVVCASIDDYLTGLIKKHENTRAAAMVKVGLKRREQFKKILV